MARSIASTQTPAPWQIRSSRSTCSSGARGMTLSRYCRAAGCAKPASSNTASSPSWSYIHLCSCRSATRRTRPRRRFPFRALAGRSISMFISRSLLLTVRPAAGSSRLARYHVDDGVNVGYDHPAHAAGLQQPAHVRQKAGGLAAMEMLEHVRGVHHGDRVLRVWQAAANVAMPYAGGPVSDVHAERPASNAGEPPVSGEPGLPGAVEADPVRWARRSRPDVQPGSLWNRGHQLLIASTYNEYGLC